MQFAQILGVLANFERQIAQVGPLREVSVSGPGCPVGFPHLTSTWIARLDRSLRPLTGEVLNLARHAPAVLFSLAMNFATLGQPPAASHFVVVQELLPRGFSAMLHIAVRGRSTDLPPRFFQGGVGGVASKASAASCDAASKAAKQPAEAVGLFLVLLGVRFSAGARATPQKVSSPNTLLIQQ